MTKVLNLEIDNCDDCPHFLDGYPEDRGSGANAKCQHPSFDEVDMRWSVPRCYGKEMRCDSAPKRIPKWCPLKEKE